MTFRVGWISGYCEAFTAILNSPETDILAAGKTIEKPVVRNEKCS